MFFVISKHLLGILVLYVSRQLLFPALRLFRSLVEPNGTTPTIPGDSLFIQKRPRGFALIKDGFSFCRDKRSGDNSHWRCSRWVRCGCRAELKEDENGSLVVHGEHNRQCRRVKPNKFAGKLVKIV